MTSIKYDYNFLAGVYNGEVELNNYNLIIHLYIEDVNEENQQTSFARMDYFLNNYIDNSIFINEEEEEKIEELTIAGFRCITFPDPGPIDQIVQIAIVNKLNVITDDKLQIIDSELSSLRGGYVKYMYFVAENMAAEFELISTEPSKWWNDESPTYKSVNAQDEILNFKQMDSWKNIDLDWFEEETVSNTLPHSNIITMTIPEK